MSILLVLSRAYTQASTPLITPWFLTGFTDGDGYFYCGVSKNKKGKWIVTLEFGFSLLNTLENRTM